ncbi:MAG TPA: protoporphyrinogen oxidase [Candidatus Limnocylindrales bacterium]|nr:protoporphyrinogen oxidase [Candidatus Limnocylindrales bacterium]
MSPLRQAIVIGAGISGLACALRLVEMGIGVRVLEAAGRPGGMIATVERGGFLFEAGPQSFQMTPELRELIRAARFEGEVLQASPQMPRYVLLGGKLRPAPMSPPTLLTTSLLGMGSKVRVLSEAFRRSKPPAQDESFADFVRRKFGTEILEHLAGPFASGVFAGDPEQLSLRSTFPTMAQWEEEYGSVLRGAIKSRSGARERSTLAGFKRGMASFIAALARQLGSGVTNGIRAAALESAGESGWRIHCSETPGAEALRADAVVLAAPAYEAARLVHGFAEKLSVSLSGIPYAPIAVVAEGYRREHVGHALNGFGFLVPRKERLRTLGTVWNSSLFPGRAPEGMVMMTSFIGGATDPGAVDMDENEIANQVRDDIGTVLRITAPPVARQVWRHAKGLPQYNLGHAQRVGAIRDELEDRRGLFIAGNYLEGPSIGSCISQAFRTAKAVLEHLSR